MKKILFLLSLFIIISSCQEKSTYLDGNYTPEEGGAVYIAKNQHQVDSIKPILNSNEEIKNIILLVGDGMGLSQMFAAMTANNDRLYIDQATHMGIQKTKSKNKYSTDSAAAGSALATGKKTNYSSISVDENNLPNPTFLEYAASQGYSTGLIAACKITHATPAAFVAHVESRSQYEDIANYFVTDSLDLFLGGGADNFYNRTDSINLGVALEEKGFQLLRELKELEMVKEGKVAGLFANDHLEAYPARGEFLVQSTSKAIDLLSQNEKGFFLLVEGSQIDWAGHDNDLSYLVEEMLDFDRAVGVALKFAEENKNTLVIITGDHETGGFSLNNGSPKEGLVEGKFTTTGHTAVGVPVYTYGPGAEKFMGFYENTAIFEKMMNAFGISH